jgi:hypothetical protein
VEIRMPAVTPPLKVVADGMTLAWAHRLGESGWTYDGSTATVIIRLPRVDLMHGLTVTVEKDGRVPEKLAYGLRGQLARLARVSYHSTLATSVRIQHPRERLGVDAAQAGNRIGRNPASFADEVKRLHRVVRELPTVLKELMNTKTAKLSDQARKNRNEACAKALAILRAMEEDG